MDHSTSNFLWSYYWNIWKISLINSFEMKMKAYDNFFFPFSFFLFQMIFLGFEVNLVWATLLFFSIFLVISSLLINLLEPITPKIISDALGYGKTTNSNLSTLIKFIQVPKSYFTHFYIFATLFMGSLWIFTI